jgi:RNA polymerase sigma-54 factor
MNIRLEQKLELRLSPILLQRLDLLMLPQLELQQLIRQELETNPCLEKDEDENDDELPLPEEIDEWDSYPRSTESHPEREKTLPVRTPTQTLKDYLLSQLRISVKDPDLLKIAEHIIYELNEDGYLMISVEEIAKFFDKDTSNVELALKQIQQFDPVGVGARDLQECLLIQLKAMKKAPKAAFLIVHSFFDSFIDQDYAKLKAQFKGSDAELDEALECIKSCRPKPGKMWEGEARYVVPEVVVERDGDRLDVSLTSEWIPKFRLSKYYQDMLRNKSALSSEEKEYLRKKLKAAKLLFEGIEKRRETVTAIANYIVKTQHEFLTRGKDRVKYVTLEEVGQAIERNPSTVSRAIKGKWIQTPRGAFLFKAFFSGGKIKDYPQIVHQIKQLIENEDKTAPLRDGEIAKILQTKEFPIARTTVIKYRNQLGIPTARNRKRP